MLTSSVAADTVADEAEHAGNADWQEDLKSGWLTEAALF
jgi:hypothetical protein